MSAFRSPLKTALLGVAAALALSAAAAPALAQDALMADFQTICAAGDGDPAKAEAAIDGQGDWSPLDPAMFGGEVPFDNLKAWMKPSGGGFLLAMTGDMTEAMDGMGAMNMNMGVCALGGQPADYAGVNAAISTWVGGPPREDLSQDGNTGFVFSLKDGQMAPIDPATTEEGLAAQMLTGDLRMVMTADQGGVVMVMYMEPKVQ